MMVDFRKIQDSLKAKYFIVKLGENKIRVYIFIDRGGRIIDCTRIGRLFGRIYGKQYISLAGVNASIVDIVYDEVERINEDL